MSARDWKAAPGIEPDAIAEVFARNGFRPCRLTPFGDADLKECDGLSAIVADRKGYDRARAAWVFYSETDDVGLYRRLSEAFYRARSEDIGLTRAYALGYLAGWDGRDRFAWSEAGFRAEFERGHADGVAGYAAVVARLGIPDQSEEVSRVVADQVVA